MTATPLVAVICGSRSASRANFSSSPRKLPSYEPRENTHDEIAENHPTVWNSWVTRVPSPSGSKVALDRPRRIQLPNLLRNVTAMTHLL